MNIKKKLSLLLIVLGLSNLAHAQWAALKTNLLTDATLSPNLALEVGLAPRWTFETMGEYNGWVVDGHKWKHWFVQPEGRYWFCDRFAGHFVGVHALYGEFNFANIRNNISFLGSDFSKLRDHRYQGWAVGGGVAYGYDFILGRHWNLELEAGFGYLYTRYDRFECIGCGKKVDSGEHHYIGPTKAALSLVYLF